MSTASDPSPPASPHTAAEPSDARVLVGVGSSPFAAQLLRAAYAFAQATGSPWTAVHVETSRTPSAEARRRLSDHLVEARSLGADVVVTRDHDVAAALRRVAAETCATHLFIGHSQRWHTRGLLRRTLAEQLVAAGQTFAIHVVPTDEKNVRRMPWAFLEEPRSRWSEYCIVLAVIAAVTAGGLLFPPASHLAIGLVYLLAVICLSLFVGRGPVLLAGIVSAGTWEYVFIPPRFAFAIATSEDALLIGTYVVVALVAGQLTARVRAQALNERKREERATALLELTRVLANAPSFDAAVTSALRQVDALFRAQTTLGLIERPGGALGFHPASGYEPAGVEAAAADRAMAGNQPTGRFTRAASDAVGYYVPLRLEQRTVGVLGVAVGADEMLSLGQRDLIEAFARQLALLAERERLRVAGEREKLLAASEKLHRALFDSVSHELRTPLAVIDAAIDGLADASELTRGQFVDEVRIAARRLNRLVANLLDQTRLESGSLKPRLDWCNARDLVNAALDGTRDALAEHPVQIDIPDELPPIRADFALTEHALMNLVLNAALYTPPACPIRISVAVHERWAVLAVEDRGPGFPPVDRERLFKKFIRGDSSRAGGLGLGLSIVRGLVTAQGGDVSLGDNPGGGAIVQVRLPHHPASK